MIMKFMAGFRTLSYKIPFHLEKKMTSPKKGERGFQPLYKIIGIVENKIRGGLIKVQCLIPMSNLMIVMIETSISKLRI